MPVRTARFNTKPAFCPYSLPACSVLSSTYIKHSLLLTTASDVCAVKVEILYSHLTGINAEWKLNTQRYVYKGKFSLCGGTEVQLHPFLTKVSGKLQRPGCFTAVNNSDTHQTWGWVGTQSPSASFRKEITLLHLSGFETRTIRLVQSNYTDWAIPVHHLFSED
jgi:hypothetical protein